MKREFGMNVSFSGAATLLLLGLVALTGCSLTNADPQNAAIASGQYSAPAGAESGITLQNLQTAFNGESNARAKYLEYAKTADAEGYTKVGSLFRAAARAEEIHAANHASVIKSMGGEPKSEIKLPEIKATKDNLDDAIKGETYERDVMYTDFIKQAREAGNANALRTFNFARSAEAEHAKLYSQALASLEDQKGGPATYLVCPKCGFTTSDTNLEKCPVDFTPKEKFETIS